MKTRHLLFLALGALACERGPGGGKPYDLVIAGGMVVDGLGGPRTLADVAIRGDRIVRVEEGTIPADSAALVLDARGLTVAPGFFDNHAHIATNIHEYPLAENFTRQGITTILASLHSGDQAWPMCVLGRYVRELKVLGRGGHQEDDLDAGGSDRPAGAGTHRAKPGMVLRGPARRPRGATPP